MRLALFLIVAVVFPIVPLVLSRFIAPNKPNPVKLEPYESGMPTIGPTRPTFAANRFLFALVERHVVDVHYAFVCHAEISCR